MIPCDEARHGSAAARRAMGVWGPPRAPTTCDADRGAPRLRRSEPSIGGGWGPCRGPHHLRVTVEKAAVNAVMAGCRPEYLPVLIAATECACDPAFNLHGVATSTHFSAPLIVVNGPVRQRIDLNCSFGVFGPGYRANAT